MFCPGIGPGDYGLFGHGLNLVDGRQHGGADRSDREVVQAAKRARLDTMSSSRSVAAAADLVGGGDSEGATG